MSGKPLCRECERSPSAAPQLPPPRARCNLKACFRKALNCLDWRRLENNPRTVPCTIVDDAFRENTEESPCLSPPPSMGKVGSREPSADTLFELGRFELLENRSAMRALGFFKACLKESPWHASAKVRQELDSGGSW